MCELVVTTTLTCFGGWPRAWPVGWGHGGYYLSRKSLESDPREILVLSLISYEKSFNPLILFPLTERG